MSGAGASLRLPLAVRVRLGVEIVAAYMRVRRSLADQDLPGLVARLRERARANRQTTVLSDAGRDSPRLARAVMRTMRVLPDGSRCLTRSLVLLDVLARRGIDGALVIAVQPSEDLNLDAHAWVEVDGRAFLRPERNWGRLLTL